MNKLSLLIPMGDGRKPEAATWDAAVYEPSLFASLNSGAVTSTTEPDLVPDDEVVLMTEEQQIDLEALEASELNGLVNAVVVAANPSHPIVSSRTAEQEVASLVSSLTTVSVCGTADQGRNLAAGNGGTEEDWEMLSTASSVVSFDDVCYCDSPVPPTQEPSSQRRGPQGLKQETNHIREELKVQLWKKMA